MNVMKRKTQVREILMRIKNQLQKKKQLKMKAQKKRIRKMIPKSKQITKMKSLPIRHQI